MKLKESAVVGGVVISAGQEIDAKLLAPAQRLDLQALARAGLVVDYQPEPQKITRDDSAAPQVAAPSAATPAEMREAQSREGEGADQQARDRKKGK